MRRTFLRDPPDFGPQGNPAPFSARARSVYYWWWEFLRRNDDYLRCCRRGGVGRLSKLYADFGDVTSEDSRVWWNYKDRGARLFGEADIGITVTELKGREQWKDDWSSNDVAVIAINLRMKSRRQIQSKFRKLLKKLKTTGRGRPSVRTSTALYPLHKEFSVKNLEKMIQVYDAITDARANSTRKPLLWRIGQKLNLVASAMPRAADDYDLLAYKRKVMSNSVSRLYKRAKSIIRNTAYGRFPDDSA